MRQGRFSYVDAEVGSTKNRALDLVGRALNYFSFKGATPVQAGVDQLAHSPSLYARTLARGKATVDKAWENTRLPGAAKSLPMRIDGIDARKKMRGSSEK
jgi:hypothetical protein